MNLFAFTKDQFASSFRALQKTRTLTTTGIFLAIQVVLGLAASLDLEIEQMDVKTAFLHGDLEEEIYMEQPEGFRVKGKEDFVCKLNKSLYGLKQAPRQWYKKFESVMREQGYTKLPLIIVFLCKNSLMLILLFFYSMLMTC